MENQISFFRFHRKMENQILSSDVTGKRRMKIETQFPFSAFTGKRLTLVSPLNVMTTLNVIPTVNGTHINAKSNTNRKCNKMI